MQGFVGQLLQNAPHGNVRQRAAVFQSENISVEIPRETIERDHQRSLVAKERFEVGRIEEFFAGEVARRQDAAILHEPHHQGDDEKPANKAARVTRTFRRQPLAVLELFLQLVPHLPHLTNHGGH